MRTDIRSAALAPCALRTDGGREGGREGEVPGLKIEIIMAGDEKYARQQQRLNWPHIRSFRLTSLKYLTENVNVVFYLSRLIDDNKFYRT